MFCEKCQLLNLSVSCQMREKEESLEKESIYKHSLNRHYPTSLFPLPASHCIMFRRLLIHTNFTVKRIKSVHTKASVAHYSQSIFNLHIRKMSTSNGEPVIGTHSGIFHCDEILACFMLQQLPKYEKARIVRTRDEAILKDCDIVVDVGSVYEPEKCRFDHHQKTFAHTFGSVRPEFAAKFSKVRLSSAGLIYAHFGEEVIQRVIQQQNGEQLDADCLRNVYGKVYESFIQEMDGIDNGVPQFPDEPVYRIATHLSARVGHFNSQWNSTDAFDEQAQFEKAKKMVGAEFIDSVVYFATVWWPARAIVSDAIKKRFELHESGKIIEFSTACPWKQHLYDLEAVEKCEGEILYCLFGASPTDFRIICVPKTANSFVCRKFLPANWRGIRDEQLATVSGVPGARFVHATGFIGGASTRDGTLQMAIKALDANEEEAEK